MADLLLLAALSPAGELVLALVPARDQPGLTAGAPLQLAVMQGTRTVRLRLAGLQVADGDVAEVDRAALWLDADRVTTANATPATFGLLDTVVRRMATTAAERGDATAAALAARLGEEGDDLRRRAYALLDHVPAEEQVADRLALRAASLELAVRAATALVVATGGSAMSLQAAPQRLLREAMFHLVQAQTRAVREATLQRLAERTA